MTVEERQLRAWVRTIFRRAALRWLDRETPRPLTMGNREEVRTRPDLEGIPDDAAWGAATDWWIECRSRLTDRQRQVIGARAQGMPTGAIAQALHCDPRTVRRILAEIRQQCPR
ncbi:MAG: helix-turn-helix domain-containing protein [Thermaerobacter sp.]|nr:helix-turn-helix domain-containing protein [Thermaerobacter sp.]